MAKVQIISSLKDEVLKKFKGEAVKVFELMKSLGDNPHKGKVVGYVTGILIKELKYGGFRFYFIIDGGELRLYNRRELEDMLIKFVRMSDKKSQQKVINEIRDVLMRLGSEEF